MFYHAIVKNGFYGAAGAYDLSEEDAITLYGKFLNGEPFHIDGETVNSATIPGLRVFRTQDSSETLVDQAPRLFNGKPQQKSKAIRDHPRTKNVTDWIADLAEQRINRIKMADTNSGNTVINIDRSSFTNSPVTGNMDHSTQTITVNKTSIEGWLRQITAELEKNSVRNEELSGAIDTLRAALQSPKPSGIIIKAAVEAVKAIGYGILSSAAWQYLMTHLPI